MIEKIKTLIAQGEGLKVEFKEAQGGFPKSVYETICAFSNTQGGEILLGVADNGEIKGVPESSISQYKKIFLIQSIIRIKSILNYIFLWMK